MNGGRAVAQAMRTIRALASPSGEAVSWLKNRSRKWRTRSENWARSGARGAPKAACAFNATGSVEVNKRWVNSDMGSVHHGDNLLGDAPRILLLHQLRKHTFERRKLHQPGELRRRSIGQHLSLCNHDHAIAPLLHHLQHVRDVENSLAF